MHLGEILVELSVTIAWKKQWPVTQDAHLKGRRGNETQSFRACSRLAYQCRKARGGAQNHANAKNYWEIGIRISQRQESPVPFSLWLFLVILKNFFFNAKM